MEVNQAIQACWNRAQQHLAQGQMEAAHAQHDELARVAPGHVRAHLLATQIAWNEDRVRDAGRHALEAARAAQDDAVPACDAVRALIEVGEQREARLLLSRLAAMPIESQPLLSAIANRLQQLGLHHESLAMLERMRSMGFDGPALRYYLGQELLFHGRDAEAADELWKAVEQVPAFGIAMLPLVRMHVQERGDPLDLAERGLRQAGAGTRDQAALDFARYHVFEDRGRHEDAWEALARGNARMRARNPHDAAAQTAYVDRLISSMATGNTGAAGRNGNGPQPIFILGLPRSGTTVLERMLGNHPLVADAGELTTLGHALQWAIDSRDLQGDAFLARLQDLDPALLGRRYLEQSQWRAGDKPRFIDKQPPNWWLAGFIPAALPGARILHLVRDPMDVCFSNYRAFCGDDYAYCYDLASIAATWRDHERLMAHWHAMSPGAILDVRYDELTKQPETALRRVLDFCGLPWAPGCLDIAANAAPVATLSATQVRAGLRRRGAEEWAPYATQLEPMQRMLGGGEST